LILAAGRGMRMKSAMPKVLHPILGISLIKYVLKSVDSLDPKEVCVVVGYESELIKKRVRK